MTVSHDNTDEPTVKCESHPWAVLEGDTPLFHVPGTYPPEYAPDAVLEPLWRAKQPLKAPFPYFGGKSRVASLVWERFGKVQNYVEPFFGSGAVLLGCPHPGHTETVNDADGLLANFWRATQYAPEEVASFADWPVNECVPAGTMIATPSGDVPVEHIRPGMLVWGEQNGRIVATRVVATKQSQASEFYDVGPLRLTGNHPVWTAEHGYQEARFLTRNTHIGRINSVVDKVDLVMLQYVYGNTSMANLHPDRSAYSTGALCGDHVSRQEAIQRASIARRNGRQNPPRQLDTPIDFAWLATGLSSNRGWARRWLAGCRAAMDSALSTILRSGQSYRWGRWNTRLCADAGTAAQVVSYAGGRAVSTGSYSCDEGQTTYARSAGKDSSSRNGARSFGQCPREGFQGAQGQAAISRTQNEAFSFTPGQDTNARTQTEDRRDNHKSQTGALCGDGTSLPLDYSSSPELECVRSVGQSGDSQGLSLQRVSLPIPVAVYNFQTATHNYFANSILVHNCDLHARHRWLVDHRSMVEQLMADPSWYDAQAAGWWVWGISQWIGTGWCPPAPASVSDVRELNRKLPHVGDAGRGIHRASDAHAEPVQMPSISDGRVGVQPAYAPKLGHKMPFVASPGADRKQHGQGVHGIRLSQQMPHLGGEYAAGQGVFAPSMTGALYDYFRALSARLRRTRVVCGDFERILGPSVTWRHGTTAVFLDPPYADDEHAVTYSGGGKVWERATRWCEENGAHPELRIALCGYADTWDAPKGWELIRWRTAGGYGSRGNARGRENANREAIWFSPACLKPSEEARDIFSRPIVVGESDYTGTMFDFDPAA